jgi:signal transduction histidine kinase
MPLMFRSISTKLLVAVVAAVALPVAGFAFVIEYRVADKLMLELVRQSLLGIAADLGEQVDASLTDWRRDVAGWAAEPVACWAIDERRGERESGRQPDWGASAAAAVGRPGEDAMIRGGGQSLMRAAQTHSFDRYLDLQPDLRMLLLLDAEGRLVTCAGRSSAGEPLGPTQLEGLFARDWSREPWFPVALADDEALVDQHVPDWIEPDASGPEDHRVGIAHAVDAYLRPGERVGVLYATVDWRSFQRRVDSRVIQDTFRGLVAAGDVPSPYAWIWAADGDTILAHRDPGLYGTSVRSLGLEQMVEDVARDSWGLYREYEFRGEQKNAAYRHALEVGEGGLGWIIGVGIDNEDIYAATTSLRDELFRVTVVTLLIGVLAVLVVARRTTGPILELEQHTRRIAEGDLDARIEIASRDEVGRLAAAFNSMTADLVEQREQIVRAEKDAAWREMARQIAHDIKNPLTPIQLSLDLLDRTRTDPSADRDDILARTTAMMRRQVDALRGIANDFYEFTGGRRPEPEAVDLAQLLGEVHDLHRAWAAEVGVEVVIETPQGPATVFADREKLRRVLTNLVSNALQASPDGGRLEAQMAPEAGGVRLELRDTGEGLDPQIRSHLFEPYFTTKGEGTGLGLAISRRVVEEAGGWISLEPAPDDGRGGTLATLWLPSPPGAGPIDPAADGAAPA